QAGDHAQRQRHAGLHRERRVTAGEDQPEPVVLDGAERLGRVVVVQQLSLLLPVVALVLAPDPVDGLAVGGGGQPGTGVGGYAVESRKGPSVNIASSPRLSMTVAEPGAARPPAKTQ